MKEEGQTVGARADDGERGLWLRVASLQDGDQRAGQLVPAVGPLAGPLGLVDKVHLQGG